MKKIVYVLLTLCFNISAAEPLQGIEVTGKAQVEAVPDIFSVTLMVNHRGVFASKVKAIVDNKSEQVVKAALALGIAKDNIQSSQINMSINYEQPSIAIQNSQISKEFGQSDIEISLAHKQGKTSKAVIDVNRTILITLDDIKLYERLLDSSVKLGVNRISPLTMSFSSHQKYYQQAVDNAISDASIKALKIAKQLGVNLGKIKYIKESGYGIPSRQLMAREGSGSFTPFLGTQVISAQVLARFEIVE